jgi:hypothetical protein
VDLDEWLFLVDGGVHPAEASARLGVSVSAIERAAGRHNRPDITARCSGARSAERTHAA